MFVKYWTNKIHSPNIRPISVKYFSFAQYLTNISLIPSICPIFDPYEANKPNYLRRLGKIIQSMSELESEEDVEKKGLNSLQKKKKRGRGNYVSHFEKLTRDHGKDLFEFDCRQQIKYPEKKSTFSTPQRAGRLGFWIKLIFHMKLTCLPKAKTQIGNQRVGTKRRLFPERRLRSWQNKRHLICQRVGTKRRFNSVF